MWEEWRKGGWVCVRECKRENEDYGKQGRGELRERELEQVKVRKLNVRKLNLKEKE